MVEKTRRQSFSFFTDARACSRYSACRISVPTSLTLSLKFDVYHVFERQMEISVEYYKTKGENHVKTNVSTHKSMVVRIYVRLSSYYPSLRKSTNPIPFTWFACHDWADHYTLLLLVLNNNCIYSFFRPVLVHELSFILIYQGDTLRSLLPSLSQPYIIVVTKVVVYPSALTVDLTLSTKLA